VNLSRRAEARVLAEQKCEALVVPVLRREPGADLATYFVDAESGRIAEALAHAVVAGGFGLRDIGPAAVDLETLFLSLTSGHAEST